MLIIYHFKNEVFSLQMLTLKAIVFILMASLLWIEMIVIIKINEYNKVIELPKMFLKKLSDNIV